MRRARLYFSVIVLFAILVIPIPIMPAISTNGVGWLDGWSHRKSHVINPASGAGTNYQVKIIVHYGYGTDSGSDVYCSNLCRIDFGDIRFTDNDGVTLLDYWIEKKIDSHNATFWVEIADDLSSSDVTIYVYYGNPTASTVSDGDATFILFDSYDDNSLDASKWNWQLDNNNASNVHLAEQNQRMESWKEEGSGVSGANYRESDDSWQLERIVEFELYVDYDRNLTGGYAHAWSVWEQGDGNKLSCTHASYNSTHFRMILEKVEGGSHTPGDWAYFSWGTWYYVRTRINSTSIVLEVFSGGFDETLEHVQYLSHTRSGYGRFHNRLASGASATVGFRYFDDDFRVRKYTYPEPTHGSWEGEQYNWLAGWGYRKSHIIQNASGAGTNYLVKITVYYDNGSDYGGNVFCNNHCRADFGDIRFTEDDGVTLLDYWIEEKLDWYRATFWVEVADNLSNNDALIYVYYGNSQASTTSNGENIFIFFDDFENVVVNTTKWDLYGIGPQDNISIVNNPSGPGRVMSVTESGNDSALTYAETSLLPDSGTIAVGYRFRYDSYYTFSRNPIQMWIKNVSGITFHKSGIYYAGDREFEYYIGPDYQDYYDYLPKTSTDINTWYALEWQISNSGMTLVKDGSIHTGGLHNGTYSSPRYIDPLYYNGPDPGTVYYDNFYIRRYVDPEPQNVGWGDEEFNWLAGWSYRKSHIIYAAAGADTNYQVMITVHYGFGVDLGADVYCGNICKADFGDIRFTDDDGITLLDYWMEEKTNYDMAIFWVEIADNLSSNSALIYMYYGNGDANTTSNGDATFLWFDGFGGTSLDTNKWDLNNSPTVIVAGGECRISSNGGEGILFKNAVDYDNVRIDHKAKRSDYNRRHTYSLAIGTVPHRSNFIWHHSGGAEAPVQEDITYTYFNGSWSGLDVVVRDLNINQYYLFSQWKTTNEYTPFVYLLDYRQMGTADPGNIPDDTYRYYIFVHSIGSGTSEIVLDWVRIRKYVYPEPSHGDWKGGPTDTESPLISYVDYSPTQPSYLEEVVVTTEVLDHSGLSSVILIAYNAHGPTWTFTPMFPDGGTTYNTTIPARPNGTQVSFLIEATDTVGNTVNSSIFSYTVGGISDGEPPNITYVDYFPKSPNSTDSVTVEAEASDQSGISFVILYYDIGSGSTPIIMYFAGGSTYNATIPPQSDGTLVSFFIRANDTVGNIAYSQTYAYNVSDIPTGWTNFTIDATGTLNVMLEVLSNQSIQVDITGASMPGPSPLQRYQLGSAFRITANISSGFFISIHYYYTTQELNALSLNESTLAIYYWNSTDDSWYELSTYVVTVTDELVATVDHLTIFAVFGQLIPSDGGIDLTWLFIIAGIGAFVAIGIAILIKTRTSRVREPVAEPAVEPAARPTYEEEIAPEEPVPEEIAPAPVEAGEPRPLPVSEPVCSYCGHQNPAGARYCIRCGRHLDELNSI